MKMFIPITKVDEQRREVWGILAEEAVDKAKEIFDYASSVPYFKEWNTQFQKMTDHLDQPSMGNLREMHGKSGGAAGKFIAVEYDDPAKKVRVGAKVVDDQAWKKCMEGVYTGFSVGGDYVKRWDDPVLKATRYTARPVEGSLVDNPCMYGATFEAVKLDGTGTELRKFVGGPDGYLYELQKSVDGLRAEFAEGMASMRKLRKEDDNNTKTHSGEAVPMRDHAYVGDPKDKSTWHLPVHDEGHVRAALGRFNQTDMPDAEKKKTAARRIVSEAKKHGIDASGFAAQHAKTLFGFELKKSMQDVSALACILEQLACIQNCLEEEAEYEMDESELPAKMREELDHLGQLLVQLAQEESKELVGQAAIGKEVTAMVTKLHELSKVVQKAALLAPDNTDLQKMATHLAEIGKHVDRIANHHRSMGDSLKELLGEGELKEKSEEPVQHNIEHRTAAQEDAPAAKLISGAMEKYDSRLTAMEASFEKQSELLTAFIGKFLNQPAPSQVVTTVVDKGNDGHPPVSESVATKGSQTDMTKALEAARASISSGPSRVIVGKR